MRSSTPPGVNGLPAASQRHAPTAPLLGRLDLCSYPPHPDLDRPPRYRFVASLLLIKYTAAAALQTGPGFFDVSTGSAAPYLRGLRPARS